MTKLKNVVIFILIIFVGYLATKFTINLFNEFFNLLSKSDPTVSVAIITGALTILATVWAKSLEKRLEIDREHRKLKIQIYQKFLPKWLDVISNEKVRNIKTEDEMLLFIKDSIGDLITYASGGVLKAFINFRMTAAGAKGDSDSSKAAYSMGLFLAYEKVISEIRKDLGHRDWLNLQRGDIMRIFINDYDQTKNLANKNNIKN